MTKRTSHPRETTKATAASSPFRTATHASLLTVRIVDGPNTDISLTNRGCVTFGRGGSADVHIDHRSVSKVHFSLHVVPGGVELEDRGSKNGTWFAKRRVAKILLAPGDVFWAGSCRIELVGVGQGEVQISAKSEFGEMFGSSVVMRALFARAQKFSSRTIDLLLQGESGTGKELFARAIHGASLRADEAFVVLDCSTLASTLADGTIFGFRSGAFTGATYDQPGMFEQADGGTLFIDEVGELSPALQMKFLRAIDRREVSRLGEHGNVRKVDVRIIAGTNRDLLTEVEEGRFRSDLYHRIAKGKLYLPALRDRGGDILELADIFLAAEQRKGAPHLELGDDAKALLSTYDWPGNVRELQGALEEAAVVCQGEVIGVDDLSLGRAGSLANRIARAVGSGRGDSYETLHGLIDAVFLPSVIKRSANLGEAVKELGITRNTLRSKLKKLGLYDTQGS